MKYDDIASTGANRFRLPSSHPILVELFIDPADWDRFHHLAEDSPAVRILGHGDPENGRVAVHIACAATTDSPVDWTAGTPMPIPAPAPLGVGGESR